MKKSEAIRQIRESIERQDQLRKSDVPERERVIADTWWAAMLAALAIVAGIDEIDDGE